MILRNLKLENIRSYTNESVDFPEGTVLLSGDIGAGKSSVLLAVEFALFGIMRGVLSGSSLLRHGAENGAVELTFSLGEKRVTVKRMLKRKAKDVVQDSGYIVMDDVRQDLTPMELKSKVLELLGYPPSLLTKSKDLIFRYTVYTPQEEMKAILFDQKDMRLDTLRRLFQVDKYRTIRENSKTALQEIRSKARALEGATADIEELKRREDELKAQAKNAKQQVEGVKPKLEEKRNSIKEKNAELESLEKQRKEFESLRREESALKTRLSGVTEQFEKKVKEQETLEIGLKHLKAKLDELPEQKEIPDIKALQERLTESTAKRTALEAQLKSLQGRTAELQQEAPDEAAIQKDLAERQTRLKSLHDIIKRKAELASKKSSMDSHRKEITNLLSLNEHVLAEANEAVGKMADLEQCPLCQQKVPHEHRESILTDQRFKIKTAEKVVGEAKAKLTALEKELGVLSTDEKSLQQAREGAIKIEAELDSFQQALVRLEEGQKKLAEMKKTRTEVEQQLKVLPDDDSLVTQLEEARLQERAAQERNNLQDQLRERQERTKRVEEENERLSAERAESQEKLATLHDRIQKFKNLEDAYAEYKSALEALRQEEQVLLTGLTKASTTLASLESEQGHLRERLVKKANLKQKHQHLKHIRDWTEKEFIPLMHLIERQVMHRLRQEFSELFQRYYSILLEGEEISVRLDEEFAPVVEQNGYEMPTQDLSGGERTSLALAYRLAITSVVNDAVSSIQTRDLIILDEPTDGFSSEQLDKLRMVLDELDVRQIVIVSHESKIESFVESVITVNKSEHISRITTR